jgi:hypothetical protein
VIDRLFLRHPRDVNESYGEHMMVASRIGVTLIGAGLASLVHGLVPGWFTRTGSSMIRRLHKEISERTPAPASPKAPSSWAEWEGDYQI